MYTSQLKAVEVCSTLNKIVTSIATRGTQTFPSIAPFTVSLFIQERKKNLFGNVTLTYGSRTRSAPASATP
jgi:hypothetical protein